MHPRMTGLERAFDLAGSGRFTTLEEVVKLLRKEGYSGGCLKNEMAEWTLRSCSLFVVIAS
jgi:hypothetical protein